MAKLTIEDMAVFCKKKGFVYPNSEIYGGFSGFWDYGHLGVELKNNIKNEWWKYHVQSREDIVGIDGSIITHPKVWEASGHVESFQDIMLTCSKCKEKIRADHFIQEKLQINVEGHKAEEINDIIKKNKLKCPKCSSDFEAITQFNLMFKTNVGPKEDKSSIAYLRPETAQLIFADFKLVADNARLKLPFGIAQAGRAFRNEISPRDFLFRSREFEQMEIEYFAHPDKAEKCPYIKEVMDAELNFYSAEMQQKNKNPARMKVEEALNKKLISEWHAYWLATEQNWFTNLGAKSENFRVRQHLKEEKSHYALDTWDLEYNFPFGWKELQGIANRTDFDLKQHMKFSGKDLSLFDEDTKQKVVPHVVCEPSLGVDRAFLVFMFDAYSFDNKRGNVVLNLHPKLAPIKVGVFPLLSNKPQIAEKAREVYDELKKEFACQYDSSGSIGRRYSRQDEIGTPLCVTIDFQTLEDFTVTIRDRDTTQQIRVKISELKNVIARFFNGEELHQLAKLKEKGFLDIPKDAYTHFIHCLKILLQEIKNTPIEYNSEADIHFAFYYILNKENNEFFWKKRAIECFGYEEQIRGRPDITIYDPEKEEESAIKLIAEIKSDSPDRETTKKGGKRIRPIKIDIDKLIKLKNNYNSKYPSAKYIFLYIGIIKNLKEIKAILNRYEEYKDSIEFIVMHKDYDKLFFNEDIFDKKSDFNTI